MLESITRIDIAPGTLLHGHTHAGLHMCAVEKGEFAETDAWGRRQLRVGHVRISPAAKRDIAFGPSATSCLVADLAHWPFRTLDQAITVDAPEWALRALTDASDLAETPHRFDDADMALGEVLVWALNVPRSKSLPPRWMSIVRDSIRSTGTSHHVKEIAARAGVHPTYLTRAFRNRFGVSASAYLQYVREIRMLRLLAGEAPLSEVAASAGFFDQAHLCRWVRRRFATTPTELRDRLHLSKT